MASSWWPFRLFSKGSSSSPANFLHLSRTNIERIWELTSSPEPLNPHQCRSMSSKMERTMQSIERIVDSVDDISLICGSAALENFYRVSEKGKQLVESCCSVDWCRAVAFQIQNEEAFKEILLETGLSYNTICKVVEDMNKNKECLFEDLRETSTFDPSSADEVFKDRVALQDRLKGLVNDANISSSNIQSRHLGEYLMWRVDCALQHSRDEDFDAWSFNLWSNGKGPDGEWSKHSEYLGSNVCKTSWLGIPCAKKLFKEDEMREEEWLAEAKILASLSHPNIVKFLCCNKYEETHSRGHFIAMEQMETSLGYFIRRLKEGAELSLFSKLDIMLQIAYGMCYLHENGIAHRDLKTSNVVVRRVSSSQLQHYLQVKVVDFGISKMKLRDKSTTVTRPKIGTTVYMPPEAFSDGRANWFKADMYSFSVMCSVILSGAEPFQDVKRNDLCRAICSGRRPNLPGDIPKELASLIMEGWATDRNLRPTFSDACTRLEKLRHRLLRDDSYGSSLKQKEPDSNLYIERMLKRRSEARKDDCSHDRPQTPILCTVEEEWFEGDEEHQDVIQVQQFPLQEQRGAENASTAGGAEQYSQSGTDGFDSRDGPGQERETTERASGAESPLMEQLQSYSDSVYENEHHRQDFMIRDAPIRDLPLIEGVTSVPLHTTSTESLRSPGRIESILRDLWQEDEYERIFDLDVNISNPRDHGNHPTSQSMYDDMFLPSPTALRVNALPVDIIGTLQPTQHPVDSLGSPNTPSSLITNVSNAQHNPFEQLQSHSDSDLLDSSPEYPWFPQDWSTAMSSYTDPLLQDLNLSPVATKPGDRTLPLVSENDTTSMPSSSHRKSPRRARSPSPSRFGEASPPYESTYESSYQHPELTLKL